MAPAYDSTALKYILLKCWIHITQNFAWKGVDTLYI